MLTEAKYSTDHLPSFAWGNPLTECLPAIPLGPDLARRLLRIPMGDFTPGNPLAYLELPSITRAHVPRPESVLIAARTNSMLINRYVNWNPLSSDTQKRINGLSHDTFNSASTMGPPAEMMTVLGRSGMGKSTVLSAILSLYPRLIAHTEWNGKPFRQLQIPFLSIDAPIGGSIKGLLLSFAEQLDDLLDLTGSARYVVQFSRGGKSIESQKVLMALALAAHCVGLIHIDDIQRIGERSISAQVEAAATIIGLCNSIGAALLLSGTPEARKVVFGNFEAGRRASSRGVIAILAPQNAEDAFFSGLVEFLFSFQASSQPTVATPELSDHLLNLTAGNTAVLVALYLATQEVSLLTNRPMTAEMFETVLKQQFFPLIPALNQLNAVRGKGQEEWDLVSDDELARQLRRIQKRKRVL